MKRPALRHRLRGVGRLVSATLHGFHGIWIASVSYRSLDEAGRQAKVQWWARTMLARLGVTLEVDGAPRPGGTLLVANHVSWLDIQALHAVCPRARFVSKADVRRWPLLRRLADAAGTLYLERERPRDAVRVVHVIAEALQAGDMVAVFPEGTTSDGHGLLPFHANLLQAAIAAEAPVQPVALRYRDAHEPVSRAAAFIGDTTLMGSLWDVACADRMVVRLTWLAPLGTRHADRRALAQRLQDAIGAVLDRA